MLGRHAPGASRRRRRGRRPAARRAARRGAARPARRAARPGRAGRCARRRRRACGPCRRTTPRGRRRAPRAAAPSAAGRLGAHGPLQRVLALAPLPRAALEQHPRRAQAAALRGVGERHRAADARAGVEQQLQARRVLGAGGDAQRAPVVGIGAGFEQQRRQPRLVGEAGGAVQRRHALVPSSSHAAFGSAPAPQQRIGAGDEAVGALAAEEGRVGDVEQRLPAARAERAARRAGIARPAPRRRARRRPAPARRRARARQAGIERQQRLGVVAAPARRPLDERAGALAARHGPRLRVAHERRPAARAELARDRQLRVGEPRRAAAAAGRAASTRSRAARVAARAALQQRLGLAPRAGEIDRPSVHHDHLRRAGGPQHGRRSIERAGTWPSRRRGGPGALPADRVRPRARERSYRRCARGRKGMRDAWADVPAPHGSRRRRGRAARGGQGRAGRARRRARRTRSSASCAAPACCRCSCCTSCASEPSYGGRLMERVGEVSGGLIAVNPNTMYPLLRELEAQGLVRASGSTPSAARGASTASPTPARPSAGGWPPSSRRAWTPSPTSLDLIRARAAALARDGPRARQHRRSPASPARPRSCGTTPPAGRASSTACTTSRGWRATGRRPARACCGTRSPAGAGACRSA